MNVQTKQPKAERVVETALSTGDAMPAQSGGVVAHSPYLVAKLKHQRPNLYGTVKFRIVAAKIRALAKELGRNPRVLDLGCSTAISKHYLEMNGLDVDYCGVDYEAAFEPDIVMDVRNLHERRDKLPWVPDVIMLLDVLEHLPGQEVDIRRVMDQCNRLIPEHGLVLVVVPQLYRLDRLKLRHLHYPEHTVRFTLREWIGIVERVISVQEIRGIGYLSCLSYLPMLSPWYREDNRHGRLFRFLRGRFFEWGPFKPLEIALTKVLGRMGVLKGWCNSSLLVCRAKQRVDES